MMGVVKVCADSKYLYYFSSVPPRNVCRITRTVDAFLLNDEDKRSARVEVGARRGGYERSMEQSASPGASA